MSGVYEQHSYLPAERRLAKELGVSRATLSSALATLSQSGLVTRNPGRGTRVLPLLEQRTQSIVGILHNEQISLGEPHLQGIMDALRGVLDIFKKMGVNYRLLPLPRPYHPLSASDLAKRFGAMLFLGLGEDNCHTAMELERSHMPVVVAKLESPEDPPLCATVVDHRTRVREAVRVFVHLGHQRIAHITREMSYAFYDQAQRGYMDGLAEAGLPVDDALTAFADKTDSLSGYFAAKQLLQLPNPPTAIVAARDAIAEGVCRAIEDGGLQVGRDVSVIGFDGLTWPQSESFLTTFREPCYDMGACAAEMLIDRILNGWRPPEKKCFDTTFVLRRSAGPAPR